MARLTQYMDIFEFQNYIENAEISVYPGIVAKNAAEAAGESDGERRMLFIADHLDTPESENLKFEFKFLNIIENSIWLRLDFENYKMINTDTVSDRLSIQFKNTSLIVSDSSGKEISDDLLDQIFEIEVPSLLDTSTEAWGNFESFLFYF